VPAPWSATRRTSSYGASAWPRISRRQSRRRSRGHPL